FRELVSTRTFMNLQHQSARRLARLCVLFLFVGAAVFIALHPSLLLAADEGGEGAAGGGESSTLLWWIIKTSGFIGVVIFVLSFYFVAVVIQQFLELRQSVAAPPEIIEECERLIGQRNIQQLYDTLRGDDSYFSRSLSAGIVELQHGVDEAREKLDRQAD